MPGAIQIRCLQTIGDREIQGLSDVLIDCVEGGASVSFMLPMSRAKADAFWDQPENQPHRGDIAKMLVHRRVRRRGVGAALLAAAERSALSAGKTLLVLDTVTGSDGERLYARQGWQRCGQIPNYALWPDGTPCATTIFFKLLRN
jgi:GNAT superfamily N-acetyltransferase